LKSTPATAMKTAAARRAGGRSRAQHDANHDGSALAEGLVEVVVFGDRAADEDVRVQRAAEVAHEVHRLAARWVVRTNDGDEAVAVLAELRWEYRGHARDLAGLAGDGVGVGAGSDDELDGAGAAGAERVLEEVVADARLAVLGEDGNAGHAGLEAEQRARKQEQHAGHREGEDALVLTDPVGEVGPPGAAMVANRVPREGDALIQGPMMPRSVRRREDECVTESIMPAAIERKPDGHEEHSGEADEHGQPAEEHCLASGVHRHRDGACPVVGVA
jgi:hypothetical protein